MNPTKSYNFSGMKVLIVDGSPFMRAILRNLCRGFGVGDVLEANDGTEALAMMRNTRVDFILCDLKIQPLDGFDLTRLIRASADSPNPLVPIIMLTSETHARNVGRARDVGVTEFLAKPVSAESLLQRMIYICENPRNFVRVNGYFGPDRRRREVDPVDGEKRGKGPREPVINNRNGEADGWGLTEDEIQRILYGEPGSAPGQPARRPA